MGIIFVGNICIVERCCMHVQEMRGVCMSFYPLLGACISSVVTSVLFVWTSLGYAQEGDGVIGWLERKLW